jgi:hypothetical protein
MTGKSVVSSRESDETARRALRTRHDADLLYTVSRMQSWLGTRLRGSDVDCGLQRRVISFAFLRLRHVNLKHRSPLVARTQ